MPNAIKFLVAATAWAMSPAWAGTYESDDAPIQIRLRPQIVAQQQQVLLGDIAILHTRDLGTIQRLAALPLGQAPGTGREVVVRREAVARWVRSQLGISPAEVAWSGADETRISTVAQEIPAARIEQVAKEALQQWLAQHSTRYAIETLAVPRDLALPMGKVEFTARPLTAGAEPSQRMVVWLDAQVDGRVVRTVAVSFVVQAYREAWVAPSAIANGVALTADKIERREVEITGRAAGTVPAKSAQIPLGWQTTRALKNGEAVTARNVAPAPLVARGEWVALHMKSGDVELEGRAQALQDGELGQTVKVRSTNAPAPVSARVVAPGRVEAML